MRREAALPRQFLGAPSRPRTRAPAVRGPVPRSAAGAVATRAPAIRTRLGFTLDSWLGRSKSSSGLQRERHQPEYLIVLAVIALTAIGILMVYSSSAVRSYVEDRNTLAVVGPQLVWAVLGVIAMVITMNVDYRWWRLASIPMFGLALALLVLVLVLPDPFAIRVGGSARWLQFRPLPAVHPAEFAKLALVVYLAHWMARRGYRIRSLREGTLPFLLIVAPVILLVVREPDLGTTSVIAFTAFALFFVAGARIWQFVLLIPAGLAAGAVVILHNPYQLERIKAFLDPFSDPTGIGFHAVQGLFALGLGGPLGEGLGASRQAAGLYLPNASNDFIFAIIGEEFGLIGGVIVIALFALFAYQGFRVALSAPDTFGGLLAAGITAWLTIQALINIGVVVALLPITGITLPFISAGGSSLSISLAAVGILLSVSRETLPRGTWNDADPDRGGRDGRTRLPGSRRRPLAARVTARG